MQTDQPAQMSPDSTVLADLRCRRYAEVLGLVDQLRAQQPRRTPPSYTQVTRMWDALHEELLVREAHWDPVAVARWLHCHF
ncbi:hypothetical protein EIP91_007461 [Steccherinum ochraceum]|uniref:Uncharacterized protein n=1 Tax=Steccherinum ochraceum TaxID=92696 RepID=A0A4V2MVE9_9APHY|nr:hypothetical protein EIP91_007461 [Steccherinum ochraceum]